MTRSQFLLSLVLLVLVSCTTVPADADVGTRPEPVLLTVSGAEEMVTLMTDLAAVYADDRPRTTIEVSGGGSRWGLRAASSGAADVGMVSRPLDEDEAPGLRQYQIAHDAVAVIVHPSNPVATLSQADLGAIFSGETFRWDAFGWDAGEITIVTRETGAGDRIVFETYALGDRELTLSALIAPTPGAVVETVANTPNAIGYVGQSQVSGTVKVVAVDTVHLSKETIADGTYPLERPLLLVTAGRPRGSVRGFITWVRSDTGQAIVERDFVRLQR